MSNFEDVKTFMKTFGQIIRNKPQFPDEKTMQLRFELIKEELSELEEAMKSYHPLAMLINICVLPLKLNWKRIL